MFKYVVTWVVIQLVGILSHPPTNQYGLSSTMNPMQLSYMERSTELSQEFDNREDMMLFLRGMQQAPPFPTWSRITDVAIDSSEVSLEEETDAKEEGVK